MVSMIGLTGTICNCLASFPKRKSSLLRRLRNPRQSLGRKRVCHIEQNSVVLDFGLYFLTQEIH